MYNASFFIRNAAKADISTILKDYVGLSGYRVTYENEETGAYRIVVGRAIDPGSELSKTYSQYNTLSSGQDGRTTIGESSTVKTATPAQKQIASIAVQMTQSGSDVFLNIQSTGDLDASDQAGGFIVFLKGKGYTVQEVKS